MELGGPWDLMNVDIERIYSNSPSHRLLCGHDLACEPPAKIVGGPQAPEEALEL